MIELNLQTSNKQEEIIKEYLENNVSEVLADKINNGVKIIKDNKTLINKKTLSGFMKYAYEEARKLAEKGTNCACVEDKTVYGWAIHYFEEDTIEGNLYNEDGTEYKVEIKTTTPKVEVKTQPKKPEKQQATLFNFFDNPQTEKIKETTNKVESFDIEEEIEDQEEIIEEKPQVKAYYKVYHEQELTYPNIVVLTKLGDFYEAFNENAKRIAKVLNLILTSRDVGLESKVALAGFPIHIKDKYLEKLQKQYTVLVIENDEMKFYEKQEENNSKIDFETGEVLDKEITIQNQTFDKFQLKIISVLLDGKVVLK